MASLYDEMAAYGYDWSKSSSGVQENYKKTTRKPGTSYSEIGQKAFDITSFNWPKFGPLYNVAAQQRQMTEKLYGSFYAAATPEIQKKLPVPVVQQSLGSKLGKVFNDTFDSLSQTVLKGVGGTIGNAIENVGDEAFRTAEKVGEEVARPVESLLGQDAGNLVKAAFIEPARPVQQLSAEAARVTNRAGAKIGEELGRIVDQGSNELINIGGAIGGAFSTSDEEPLPALDPAGPAMTTADAGGGIDPFNTRFFETVGKGRKRKGKGRSATIFGGQGEGIRPSLLSMKNTGQTKTLLGA